MEFFIMNKHKTFDVIYDNRLGWVQLLPVGLDETVYTWAYSFYKRNKKKCNEEEYIPWAKRIIAKEMNGVSEEVREVEQSVRPYNHYKYTELKGFNAKVVPIKMRKSYYNSTLWGTLYFATPEEAEAAMMEWFRNQEPDMSLEEVVALRNKDCEPINMEAIIESIT